MRVFSGGMVNEDSTFSNMREQYARFETPPSFGDLVDRLKVMMNVDSTESAITLRGRIDSGRGLAHYMLYPIPNEDSGCSIHNVLRNLKSVVPKSLLR